MWGVAELLLNEAQSHFLLSKLNNIETLDDFAAKQDTEITARGVLRELAWLVVPNIWCWVLSTLKPFVTTGPELRKLTKLGKKGQLCRSLQITPEYLVEKSPPSKYR